MLLTEADAARLPTEGFSEVDGYLQLRTQDKEGDPCFFLRAGKCSVYDDRPEGCRLYPIVTDGETAFLDDEHCPHSAKFPIPPRLRDQAVRLGRTLEAERAKRQT